MEAFGEAAAADADLKILQTQLLLNDGLRKQLEVDWGLEEEHKKRAEISKERAHKRQAQEQEQVRRLRVKNIRLTLDAYDVYDYFHYFGKVLQVVMLRRVAGPPENRPNRGGQKRLYCNTGDAYVTFQDYQSVLNLFKVSDLQKDQSKDKRPGGVLQGATIGDGVLNEIRFWKSARPSNRLYLEPQEGISLEALALRVGNITSPRPHEHFSEWWRLPRDSQIKLDVSLLRRIIQLKFTIWEKRYCLSIRFSSIRHTLRVFKDPPEGGGGIVEALPTLTLMFTLSAPPHIFCKDSQGAQHIGDAIDPLGDPNAYRWAWPADVEVDEDWHRTTDFTDNKRGILGSCVTYCLTVPQVKGDERLKRLISRLMEYGLFDHSPTANGQAPQRIQLPNPGQLPKEFGSLPFEARPCCPPMPFEAGWRLMCMLSKFTLFPEVLCARSGLQFLQKLQQHCCTPGGQAAVLLLLDKMVAADTPCYDPLATFKEFAPMLEDDAQTGADSLPAHCSKVPRILITPTRLVCLPPELEISNRVLRQYSEHRSRFLRVSVTDENKDTLRIHEGNTLGIKARLKYLMNEGFPLLGRTYQFLAFSNSSLRENSFWMVAALPPPSAFDADHIRSWMGDFRHIKNVAKYCARLGQCFSSSISTITIPIIGGDSDSSDSSDSDDDLQPATLDGPDPIPRPSARTKRRRRAADAASGAASTSYGAIGRGRDPLEAVAVVQPPPNEPVYSVIEDYKTEDGVYTFSDGVGLISFELAYSMKDALERVGVCLHAEVPSAFQIRFRGVKGMVVWWPQMGQGARLVVRRSMHKFRGKEVGGSKVEVLDWARFRAGTLNHQAIILLTTLGVPDKALIALQDAMVEQLDSVLRDEKRALEVVPALGQLDEGVATMLRVMLEAGISVREPFLQSMLQVVRMAALRDLRSRARLQVDRSAYLFGVVDETGTLQYGQCCVRVQRPGCLVPEPVRGQVAVTKMPCLHPGDIRVLEAVEVEGLEHVVNCIVFPRMGPRPHPSECAGSDLDGDQYLVIWEPSLLPPYTVEPFAYPHSTEAQVNEVTIQHVIDHFISYMENDNLGLIANAHKCWFEDDVAFTRRPPANAPQFFQQSTWGARSSNCIRLAEMHHMAVDFSKTGVAAPTLQQENLRPQMYPHYMDKEDKETFQSQSILGLLYDRIQPPHDPLAAATAAAAAAAECDPLLVLEASAHFYPQLPHALATRLAYENDLMKLMKRYNAHTEAELLSGCIIQPSKFYRRMKEFQLHQQVQEVVRSLQGTYRRRFCEDRGGAEGGGEGSEMFLMARASAWYYVTYHPQFQQGTSAGSSQVRLRSFPWMVSEYLRRVRIFNIQGASGPHPPVESAYGPEE